MPTLKEIKGRIASVRSTLKITSAMKLVSSAKLRKAQNAIEAMRPYEEQLLGILASLQGGTAGVSSLNLGKNKDERKTIVAIASNSSLCGGFNANAIAKVRAIRRPGDTVYAIGRKMADAMRKEGFASPEDFSALSEHPSYGPAAALVEKLVADVEAGRTGAVVLVYNHFVSTARQEPVVEVLMQRETPDQVGGDGGAEERDSSPAPFYIAPLLEPSRAALLEALVPKTRKLKLYAALLDSAAAEHAARTVAMQTATDNAENLLAELTLQYNKGRQQKITSEILDLAGGQAEN
ncbi:MAG: ATP synthase F1 subunit gamma [Candidatus Cryptobacteroides sp.]|nr:ATP synthase F1 subunit gamma [Candidatus Cryptobacteroides sp.]